MTENQMSAAWRSWSSGETKGDVTVKTDDAKAGTVDVEVTAAADRTKGSTMFKLKIE